MPNPWTGTASITPADWHTRRANSAAALLAYGVLAPRVAESAELGSSFVERQTLSLVYPEGGDGAEEGAEEEEEEVMLNLRSFVNDWGIKGSSPGRVATGSVPCWGRWD